jgi:curved DNA-binding protein CbpA
MSQPPRADPYELLRLSRDATPGEVQQAYRRAARASHPDHMPGDPEAARRFAALTAAYDMLRDPRRRASYDRTHPPIPARPPVYVPAPRMPVNAVHPLRSQPYPLTPGRRPALWAGPVHLAPPRRGD